MSRIASLKEKYEKKQSFVLPDTPEQYFKRRSQRSLLEPESPIVRKPSAMPPIDTSEPARSISPKYRVAETVKKVEERILSRPGSFLNYSPRSNKSSPTHRRPSNLSPSFVALEGLKESPTPPLSEEDNQSLTMMHFIPADSSCSSYSPGNSPLRNGDHPSTSFSSSSPTAKEKQPTMMKTLSLSPSEHLHKDDEDDEEEEEEEIEEEGEEELVQEEGITTGYGQGPAAAVLIEEELAKAQQLQKKKEEEEEEDKREEEKKEEEETVRRMIIIREEDIPLQPASSAAPALASTVTTSPVPAPPPQILPTTAAAASHPPPPPPHHHRRPSAHTVMKVVSTPAMLAPHPAGQTSSPSSMLDAVAAADSSPSSSASAMGGRRATKIQVIEASSSSATSRRQELLPLAIARPLLDQVERELQTPLRRGTGRGDAGTGHSSSSEDEDDLLLLYASQQSHGHDDFTVLLPPALGTKDRLYIQVLSSLPLAFVELYRAEIVSYLLQICRRERGKKLAKRWSTAYHGGLNLHARVYRRCHEVLHFHALFYRFGFRDTLAATNLNQRDHRCKGM